MLRLPLIDVLRLPLIDVLRLPIYIIDNRYNQVDHHVINHYLGGR